jgi:predicted RND superfamily exporter protein
MLRKLVHISVEHPKLVIVLTVALALAFALPFPSMKIDTDPENMLEEGQPDRVFYRMVKRDFGINDLIVLGITDEKGIFNPQTLGRVARIIDGILTIKGVIIEDVVSLTTTDNVKAEGGVLQIRRIMEEVPETSDEAEAIKRDIFENPMFADKIASQDGKGIAIYIPIQRKDESYKISKEIENIANRELGEDQRYYIAGLPVAEDTFGHEMFVQMGITAPLAMLFIFILLFLLFRRLSLIVPTMLMAMISVIWAMGALIGSGFTVHIMSSMIPVFLMPIAVLDSVHILSEFYDKYPAFKDKKRTILAVFDELFAPCLYTSLTTAAGFGAQVTARVPPVRVFGAFVAFGIIAAWILTVTFIPAYLMLLNEEKLKKQLGTLDEGRSILSRSLLPLGSFSFHWSKFLISAGLLGLALGLWGISQIEINDNPVNWFRPSHTIRVADRVMNRLFGGTYMAYLTVEGEQDEDIKRPEVMSYIEKLQRQLEGMGLVGKTSSVADIVKRINAVLHDEEKAFEIVPRSPEEIGQYLFLFLMSGDPNDLDNYLTVDARKANIWVQMKRGENKDMERVEGVVKDFAAKNPPPEGITLRWSGLTYINKVWQGIMVVGMLKAFLSGWVVVFLLMILLFRSLPLGFISMVPLTFAIVFTYGLVGFVGKDYDMPVAVCASLALGLSIDYAIHFIQRYREKYREVRDLRETNSWIFDSPARAIARNAIVITFGFLPLVLATLTPYVTVGIFFASLMAFSALSSLLVLPALMRLFGERLFAGGGN